MKTPRKPQNQTRDQLLEAACLVFADKGYRDATIADICQRAGANIAAVNYHFRDKKTLYAEAWRVGFHRSLKAHPVDGGVPAGAQAEQRLRGRILSLIQRFADPASHELEMIHKEMANPTGLLAEVVEVPAHPWFVAVQFHPELKSRPLAPHPLFAAFVAAAYATAGRSYSPEERAASKIPL